MQLIFEKSVKGRVGVGLPESDVPKQCCLPAGLMRKEDAALPELSELDVVRHFTELASLNFGVDTGFYPLGSCTMKYNPKVTEKIAQLEGFADLHPFMPQLRSGCMLVQGALQVMHELEEQLCEISGMDAFTLQPLAGAHGELTGMMLIAAYHKDKGNTEKSEVLIPDEAHGTNPASAVIAGYKTRSIPTNPKTGMLDLEELQKLIGPQTAAIMLTNPNTLGIFNRDVKRLVEMAHEVDAQVYYDGANLNAILGKFRPGDAGFDLMHINLHKTFATPHGGGGPGAGPVGVREHLKPYLPISRVVRRSDNTFSLEYDEPKSIGYIAPFYGNFSICLRAYAYILSLGCCGLKEVSENAVLNANYVKAKLQDYYDIPVVGICKHEFVISATRQAEKGVKALDIAKAIIDEGYHPPTIYFPLIVPEAMMIEPTETESKETLDGFIEAMIRIAKRIKSEPESFHAQPTTAPVSRPDELRAARQPSLRA